MNSSEIRHICHKIINWNDSPEKIRKQISSEYPEFCIQFPTLLEACLQSSFDETMLEFMLQKRDEVMGGLDIKHADKTVYDKLSEKYIIPFIDTPSKPL
jgi:hypothetical protein